MRIPHAREASTRHVWLAQTVISRRVSQRESNVEYLVEAMRIERNDAECHRARARQRQALTRRLRGPWPALRAMDDRKASGRGASLSLKSTAPAGSVDHGARAGFERFGDVGHGWVMGREFAGSGHFSVAPPSSAGARNGKALRAKSTAPQSSAQTAAMTGV